MISPNSTAQSQSLTIIEENQKIERGLSYAIREELLKLKEDYKSMLVKVERVESLLSQLKENIVILVIALMLIGMKMK